MRVPMHRIGMVVNYREDSGSNVVVIETGVPRSNNFKYFLYQAQSEQQAAVIARIFKEAFEVVHAKAMLENQVAGK